VFVTEALFSADGLMHALGGTMTRPFHANGVSIDSRTLQAGDLFVALKTETGDGHMHVAAALQKGAAGALVHAVHGLPDDAPLIVVGDTLAGLTALGAYARDRFTGAVAAVTGSVGKTTTKEMLRAILSASGETHAAVASYNNHWGVPLTLARVPPDADYAVIEIGMNHPGEIAPLARLAAPDVAVITAVESAHIGHMGSLEAIAREKASIAQGVLQGGSIVLPADSPLYPVLREQAWELRVLGFGAGAIQSLEADASGSTVSARIGEHTAHFRLNVPGRHMVMNALAALTAAQALGADLQAGCAALGNFQAVGGRGVQRPILAGGALLLDESYNASGASVRAALAVLKLLPARRRIAVLGDMLELGDFSRDEHVALAGAVEDSADLLFACGPWMKALFDAVPNARRGAYAETSAALAPIVADAAREGDALLVKGSLGSRMRVIVQALELAGSKD
jgi:UDP-N-acetylmuramoyl-tripeptide--D-alanyl-D-alanine ligase